MTAMTEKPLLDEDAIADLTEKIVSALKTVYDPEIPVDIYELGLIYKVDIDENFHVDVEMTLTAPGAPLLVICQNGSRMPCYLSEALRQQKQT